MQDQRIEKLAAFAINITKVLLIIYLGFEEVFKIIKALPTPSQALGFQTIPIFLLSSA